MYCFNDWDLDEWFGLTRENIIIIIFSICQEADNSGLQFPGRLNTSHYVVHIPHPPIKCTILILVCFAL